MSQTVDELCGYTKELNCTIQDMVAEIVVLHAALQALQQQMPPASQQDINEKEAEIQAKIEELEDAEEASNSACDLSEMIRSKFNKPDWKMRLEQCVQGGFTDGSDPDCPLTLPSVPPGNEVFPMCPCCASPPDCGPCPP